MTGFFGVSLGMSGVSFSMTNDRSSIVDTA
jgi:hypothetical protein